jgi:hypothetical protein
MAWIREDLFLSRMLRSHQYVGKLRSSTSMMEFCLYDQGDNPEDLDSDCEVDDELRQSIRAELAVIRYHNSKKVGCSSMTILGWTHWSAHSESLCASTAIRAQDGGSDPIDYRERRRVPGLASAVTRPDDGGARARHLRCCTLS